MQHGHSCCSASECHLSFIHHVLSTCSRCWEYTMTQILFLRCCRSGRRWKCKWGIEAGPGAVQVQAQGCCGGRCRELRGLRKRCYCLHIYLLIPEINGILSLVLWFSHQDPDEPSHCCLIRRYNQARHHVHGFTFCVFLSPSPCPLLGVWTAGQMTVSTWLWGCSMVSSAYGTKTARRKWRLSGQGAPSLPYGPSAGTLQGALTAVLLLGKHCYGKGLPCLASWVLSLPLRSSRMPRLLTPLDWFVLEPIPLEWNFLRAHLVFWKESQRFS